LDPKVIGRGKFNHFLLIAENWVIVRDVIEGRIFGEGFGKAFIWRKGVNKVRALFKARSLSNFSVSQEKFFEGLLKGSLQFGDFPICDS